MLSFHVKFVQTRQADGQTDNGKTICPPDLSIRGHKKFVQTFKQALKAAKNDPGTVQSKLSKFLLQYGNAEHSTTKEPQSKLFIGRVLSTRLDKVKPCLKTRVENEQGKMAGPTCDRQFEIGSMSFYQDLTVAEKTSTPFKDRNMVRHSSTCIYVNQKFYIGYSVEHHKFNHSYCL